jgi:hypothetical protein
MKKLDFFAEWAPATEPHVGRILQYSVELLRALGWETVWFEERDTGKRSLYRSDLADGLMSYYDPDKPQGSILMLREKHREEEPGFGLGFYAFGAVPLGPQGPMSKTVLQARGYVHPCLLETARNVLRRFVHLSVPRYVSLGGTLHYVDASGRRWFAESAPEIRLGPDDTGGAWLLAHGDPLDSSAALDGAARKALSSACARWDKATQTRIQQPLAGSSEDAPAGIQAPPVQTPSYVAPLRPPLGSLPLDPDMTVPPTLYLGPLLPFSGKAVSAPPPSSVEPSEQSGETVALGELPLLVQGFSLPRYARLRAALAKHGEDHAATLASYGLDPAGKVALQRAFFEVFQQRPELLPTFTQLVELAKLRQG